MKIIAISVQKGGTGKTATAAALTQAAAYRGKKVLAVDLDPQGNLTFALNANGSDRRNNSFSVLNGRPVSDAVTKTAPLIDVLPAAWELSTIKTDKGSARRLQSALEPVRNDYDLIVIDTPPTAGELQYNALQAATGLVIPLQADIYSLQSLYLIADTAKQIQQSNHELKIDGFILTKMDNRSTIARNMQATVTKTAEQLGIEFLGSVRPGVVVQEAAAMQLDLFSYAPNSKPAKDYLSLFDKII